MRTLLSISEVRPYAATGLVPYFFLAFLRGTLPPARRASDRPMAMACFRLVTFFPDRPLLNVPLLRSRIALFTFCDAFFPYLAIDQLLFWFLIYSVGFFLSMPIKVQIPFPQYHRLRSSYFPRA
jgi:hypothetical protein